MYSWNYNEKMMKDFIFNHAKDFGRFYCEMILSAPDVYKQFMEGFYDELRRQCGTDRGEPTSEPPKNEAR